MIQQLTRPSEAELATMTSSEIHALGEDGKPNRTLTLLR